ncbi:hypothetical protein, conserved [Babesia ovata]|uniref:Uncharacterized protein n=1 Tax=Babesia ovata TaxID=189622 RepID=A0A2H6KDQ4_9APIC|nr:uncharacterized protein BOVATA_026100 [Babesia ovata]GBE61117.1 hypothetical protein, conserved [Babesia ovata]
MSPAFGLLLILLTVQISSARRPQREHGLAGSSWYGSSTWLARRNLAGGRNARITAFVGPSGGHLESFKTRLRNSSNRLQPIKAISRTGVCVPEDVGLYGRTVVAYECLYSQDGRTQTGDEWEREQINAVNAKAPKKLKKPKKEKLSKKTDETAGEPYKRFIFPPPYNTTGMLLREGEPYLVLSTWLPGVDKDDVFVAIDYDSSNGYVPTRYARENLHQLHLTETAHKYYESIEAVPRGFEQHERSYNSTYNDLFNRVVENNDDMNHYAFYSKAKDRPPMIIINAPKNTVVKQFEFNTFGRKRDTNHPNTVKKSRPTGDAIPDRIQRAYRPFSYIDLRNVQCNMSDATLQIRAKLTHIPPPPDMKKIFQLSIGQGEVCPPRIFPVEQVHGWMYNWHHFPKYDLEFDMSKIQPPEVDPELETCMEMPDDDPMTKRESLRLMREYDEWNKKN